MNDIFFSSFWGMFQAVMKILFVAVIAGILIRKSLFKEEYVKGLSELTVIVLLPAMIFDNLTTSFNPAQVPNWWILPLLGFFTPVIFLIFIFLLYIPKVKSNLSKFPIATFQNAGYLILPIGKILYPNQFDEFAQYVFLYIMGLNPSLWSIGKVLITGHKSNYKLNVGAFITPPLIANIVSLTLVFTGLKKFIPDLVAEPMQMLGSATVPIATFVLGATIGAISMRNLPKFTDIAKILSVKYVLIPATVMFVLLQTNLPYKAPILADFLVIEAAAAPAANLILMVRKYGGDVQETGSFMLISYLSAILFMPLALGVWKLLTIY